MGKGELERRKGRRGGWGREVKWKVLEWDCV